MALITCPECGGTVSDSASYCPHCGYQINGNLLTTTKTTNNVSNVVYENPVHNGYDVLLIDYMKGKLYTNARIQEVLDCSFLDASNILSSLPCYLYNDISYNDALYIAQSLQYYGMRVAIYDPNGVATYYAPSGYNKPLPSLFNILRQPLFSVVPPRHHEFVVRRQAVRPERPEPPRNVRRTMAMPVPNQPRGSMDNHPDNKPRGNQGAPNRGGNNRGNMPGGPRGR